MTAKEAYKLNIGDRLVYREDDREDDGEVCYVDRDNKLVGVNWHSLTQTMLHLEGRYAEPILRKISKAA